MQIGTNCLAQSYDTLWKNVETFLAKDLPKSAGTEIEKISQKALAEGNDAQFLKATLMALNTGSEISPDTAEVMIQRMEETLSRATSPEVKALWHCALAKVYNNRYYENYWQPDTAARRKMEEHMAAAVADPELLASAHYTNYLPLFTRGADSKYFGNDLLHIFYNVSTNLLSNGESHELLRKMVSIYEARGNNDARLLLCLDSLRTHYSTHEIKGRLEDDEAYQKLRSLADANRSNPLNVLTFEALTQLDSDEDDNQQLRLHNDSLRLSIAREGIALYGAGNEANRLRNFVTRKENPSARIGKIPSVLYPGEKSALNLSARNLTEVKLRLTRIYDSPIQHQNAQITDQQRAARLRSTATLQQFAVSCGQPYEWVAQTADFVAPTRPGVYYVELMAGSTVLDNATFSVSTLMPVVFSYPTGQNRITVLDSRTGHPVAGARITDYAYTGRGSLWKQRHVYEADSTASVLIPSVINNPHLYATIPGDEAAPAIRVENMRGYGSDRSSREGVSIDLFTDRAIYRPGQSVQFSGIAYQRSGDDAHVVDAFSATVELYNANNKKIDSLLVSTNDFGTFSGAFTLPAEVLNGRFSLRVKSGGASAYKTFRVEEYKRPTFTAETEPVTTAYTLGDTVAVSGKAQTYTGVPVGGARVQYSVSRTAFFSFGSDDHDPQTGETTTDADGSFTIPVHLDAETDDGDTPWRSRFCFEVTYSVTAETGETADGSFVLQAGSKPTWIEHNVPAQICRQKAAAIKPFSVRKVNASGQNVAAEGSYTLTLEDGAELERGTFTTGQPFLPQCLAGVADGIYSLRLSVGTDAEPDTVRIAVFSDSSQRSIDRKAVEFAFNAYSARRDSVRVLFGSTRRQVLVFRDVLVDGRLVESSRHIVSDSLLNETFTYKADYGRGVKVCYAFVVEGKLYTHEAELLKPEPEKELRLSWSTFRSRLTPGSREEWRMHVSMPDGSPAAAQMLACMYDASLDALAKNSYGFSNLGFYRPTISTEWSTSRNPYQWGGNALSGELPVKYLKQTAEPGSKLTHWREELFSYGSFGRVYPTSSRMRGFSRKQVLMEMSTDATVAEAEDHFENSASAPMEAMAMRKLSGIAAGGNVEASLRSNFAETAFFMPELRTDASGDATIAFTLPESTTEWHFTALAHTTAMHHAMTDTSVVARKDFMVQTALPRFVRKGDRTTLPVQVTNLTDHDVEATLTLQLTDALTGAQVALEQQQVSLRAGEVRVCGFDHAVSGEQSLLVCRAMGEGSGFSDGEEHYLPVLTTDEVVTRTLPFSMTEQGTTTLRVDTLFNSPNADHRSLTVELSSNPTWYAVSALPTLAGDASSVSAAEWATRLYALSLGRHVAEKNPEIERLVKSSPEEVTALSKLKLEGMTDLTPWLQNAANEQQRTADLLNLFDEQKAAARKHTALDKLRSLQLASGAWSWYPGMGESEFITTDVAILLARIEQLTDERDAHSMLEQALEYLESEIAREVKEMRREEKKSGKELEPSELQLRYLYLRTLCGLSLKQSDARFLMDRAEKLSHELTMYGKAVMAIVMEADGRRATAQNALQSLLEHTVEKPGMGRYFDTRRAELSHDSYRIPTQCAAIEALLHFGNDSVANDMRLWLMQAKRTQMWETSRASSDAVYALLLPQRSAGAVMPLASDEPVWFTLQKGKKIVGLNAKSDTSTPGSVNYFRKTYTDSEAVGADCLKLRKPTDGLSWGCVYATFTVPASEVQTDGKGLQLSCRLEVKRAGEWTPLAPATPLHKGDHVRRVFTITADRDYDFVGIQAERAACFEPAQALSGYQWNDGLAAYRVVRDSRTEYYVEQVPKGRHTFTEELHIDRAGTYTTGISRISCVYAPEFCGTTAESTVSVE